MCRDSQLEAALLEYVELYGLTTKARELLCKENHRDEHTVNRAADLDLEEQSMRKTIQKDDEVPRS